MRLIDLPATGSFRQALLFLALFAVASALMFGFLYSQTHQFVITTVDDWLRRESSSPFRFSAEETRENFARHPFRNPGLERVFVLYGRDGRVLAGHPLPRPADLQIFDRPFDFRVPVGSARSQYRGIAHRFAGGEVALIAQNMHEMREFDEAFVDTMLWGGALTVALGLLGAGLVGSASARRLDGVALAIQRIVQGDLSERLPIHGTSGDLDRLTKVVNAMLDDIERLMHDVKGACDSVAHDLRTPLTRILARLERAQRRAVRPEDYAAAIDDAAVEIRGVLKTFSSLLRISELEDGARRAGFADIDLTGVARDVIEYYEPLAEDRDIRLTLEPAHPPSFMMKGDPSLLFDAIANLVDNAIKFTPGGGAVTVALTRDPAGVGISVQDTGQGIAAPERDAVLRRFYRAEAGRQQPGSGLGLALVSAIARLHGLQLAIDDANPGCRVSLHQ